MVSNRHFAWCQQHARVRKYSVRLKNARFRRSCGPAEFIKPHEPPLIRRYHRTFVVSRTVLVLLADIARLVALGFWSRTRVVANSP